MFAMPHRHSKATAGDTILLLEKSIKGMHVTAQLHV